MRTDVDSFLSRYLELTDSPARAILKKWEYSAIAPHKKELKDPIIDIGCGDGAFSEAAFDCSQMVGIDVSKQAAKYAKKRKVYHSVILASAGLLPFISCSINTTISVSALEHMSELDEVFRELYRVLRKSGILLFTVPSKTYNDSFFISRMLNPLSKMKSIKKRRERYIRKMENSLRHLHYFDSANKERLLKIGFSDVKVNWIIPVSFLSFWSIIRPLESIIHVHSSIRKKLWCAMVKIFDRMLSKLCGEQRAACLCFICKK